jgi:hypothetical protein
MDFMELSVRDDIHFNEAFSSAPEILVDEKAAHLSFAYSRVFSENDKNDQLQFTYSETHLSKKYVTRLARLLESRPDDDDDEVILLQVFLGVLLVHEFAHFLVRRYKPDRRTPFKLRPKFRGQRVDAGHSLELTAFRGIVKPVIGLHSNIEDFSCAYFRKLCIENVEHEIYQAKIDHLRNVISEEIDFIDFTDYLPDGVSKDEVLMSRPVSVYNEEPDFNGNHGITLAEDEKLIWHHSDLRDNPCEIIFQSKNDKE